MCVEYFTIGHPPVFDTDSPTLLGLGWGVLATWWVGLLLGVPLAVVARAGPLPRLETSELHRPLCILLAVMAALALIAGVTGYFTARAGGVWLVEPLASAVPPKRHARFLADLWAHNASYIGGLVGGSVLCGGAWRERRRRATPGSSWAP